MGDDNEGKAVAIGICLEIVTKDAFQRQQLVFRGFIIHNCPLPALLLLSHRLDVDKSST